MPEGIKMKKKLIPRFLVRKGTILTDRPPQPAKYYWVEVFVWSAQQILTAVNLSFLEQSRYFSFKYLLNYSREAERTSF
jgi:hypothetical protein